MGRSLRPWLLPVPPRVKGRVFTEAWAGGVYWLWQLLGKEKAHCFCTHDFRTRADSSHHPSQDVCREKPLPGGPSLLWKHQALERAFWRRRQPWRLQLQDVPPTPAAKLSAISYFTATIPPGPQGAATPSPGQRATV